MVNKKKLKIAILPGDGIGKEVLDALLPVFSELNLPITYKIGEIGWSCWIKEANPIPQATWDLIEESDTVLLGATTSRPEREAKAAIAHLPDKEVAYVSPIVQLRQKLDLFANVRPCFSISKDRAFNLCIIRENTEGLYSGFDFDTLPEELRDRVSKQAYWATKLNESISCTLRLQSKSGLQRIFKFAFDYANNNNYHRVTYADKPNVLRKSSTLGRSLFEEIAAFYPKLQTDISNVDAVGMHLVKKPEMFGVIVTENMFGDILSDVAGGVMGGLGLASSANIGLKHSYFEPVHGSGPRMRINSANPCAMFFSLALLLKYFGYGHHAQIIHNAVINVIQQKKVMTYDLKGSATTQEMAAAIITEAKKLVG